MGTRNDDRPLSLDAVELIAIDLDGTLLRGDGAICCHAAEAIFEAAERGIKVVVATGRAPRSMRSICKALDLRTAQICHNGALVIDPQQVRPVSHRTLPPAVARRVVEIARKIAPGVVIGIEVLDRCYTEQAARDLLARQPDIAGEKRRVAGQSSTSAVGVTAVNGTDDPAVGPFGAVLGEPVTKIMFMGEPHVLGGIQSALHERLSDHVSFACSHMKLLQVVHRQADKATALEAVARAYGINRAAVMAIGDAPNDVGMIRWAGLGVALGNAWPEVQSAAHFVMPTNDEAGVAQAIRRFVLNV